MLSDEDLKRANPEKTQTVEITDFVDLDQIQAVRQALLPGAHGQGGKSYALLREALKRTRKVGIAKVVIRSREYLSAVIPHGDVLVLEILRYPNEIRAADDLDVPPGHGHGEKEIEMAERLVEGMIADWEPGKYTDTYRDDLMQIIEARIESGKTKSPRRAGAGVGGVRGRQGHRPHGPAQAQRRGGPPAPGERIAADSGARTPQVQKGRRREKAADRSGPAPRPGHERPVYGRTSRPP